MPYAILRFQKRKAGGVAGTDRHNERKKETYKSNPDIKTEKSKENYHFVKPNGKYKDLCNERIKEAKCKVRKDSVILVETILTASPEFLREMNDEEQHQFFERAFTFISDKVGQQDIISAVVHMDETTPHMHLCFCPITEDNRLSAKRILGDRRNLEKWQDEYYEYMSKEYPDLERGIPASVSHRKHIPTYTFKQANRIEKGIDKFREALKNVNAFNAGKKRDEAMAIINEYVPMILSVNSQEKSVNDYVDSLEIQNKELTNELQIQSKQILYQQSKLTDKDYTIRYLQHQIEVNKELLSQVPEDILREIKKNNMTKTKSKQR